MAKAQFHRNQKVWVETVGTWAIIEKVVPVWAKGFDEPVRIIYELGLGREFLGYELQAEEKVEVASSGGPDPDEPGWRLMRARNKWQATEDCSHHPYPGTFPVVVTDTTDWGGWRVPGAEYDRDPRKIEQQARLITAAPRLLALARELAALAADAPEDMPAPIQRLAWSAARVDRYITDHPTAPGPAQVEAAE